MAESSTPTLEYASAFELPSRCVWRVLVVPLMCMPVAWTLGLATNAVSGMVSRTYFDAIVGWRYGGSMSLGDVMFQGLIESTAFGVVFAVVFTATYIFVTGTRCELKSVVVPLLFAGATALACWLLGGMLGVALAVLSPAGFHAYFPASQVVAGTDLTRWAFVGGSISGVYCGALVALCVGAIALRQTWASLVRAV